MAVSIQNRLASALDGLARFHAAFWPARRGRERLVNPGAAPANPDWLIGRNYALFRYMLACNRDGELPLLFNGGIFTADNVPGRIKGNNNDELAIARGGPTTPDFRRWTSSVNVSRGSP